MNPIRDRSVSEEEIGRRIKHGPNVMETKAILPHSQRKHIQQAGIETEVST